MDIRKDQIETLYESRFLRCYDLQYAEGKHYYEASRREEKDLVVKKTGEEFRRMLPDAVTIAVVLHLPGDETRLLMSYEYRYPVGQFLLSPVAGLLDPEDRERDNPLVNAAIREIREETGLTVKETDRITVLNPCAFSTPGMTDESNAFLRADLTLDAQSRTVTRAGKNIELTGKEFALLEYMLRNRGVVLTREMIENNLWNYDYEGGTNIVDVYVGYLRRKMDTGFDKKLIHTVWGSGWVLREE